MRPQTVARETEFLFSKNTILKSGHGAPLAGDSELKETEWVYFQVTRHRAIGLLNQAHTRVTGTETCRPGFHDTDALTSAPKTKSLSCKCLSPQEASAPSSHPRHRSRVGTVALGHAFTPQVLSLGVSITGVQILPIICRFADPGGGTYSGTGGRGRKGGRTFSAESKGAGGLSPNQET